MKVKVKYKLSTIVILIFGVIGFSFLASFFLKAMLSHRYLQILDLTFFLLGSSLAICSLYYLLKNELLIVENKKLIIISFFGLQRKEFFLTELISYTAIEKANKYINWEDLDLYFKSGKVRITSSNFKVTDYYNIKSLITRGTKANQKEVSKWSNRIQSQYGIAFIIIGIIFSLLFINQNNRGIKIIDGVSSIQFTGTLKQKTNIVSNRHNKKSIVLSLSEYPYFTFKLDGPEFKALDKDEFLKKVNNGDKITIKIWKDQYDKKISESSSLTFADKHFNYHRIEILGIAKDSEDFMPQDLVNYYREKFHTKFNFYTLMVIAMLITGFGIYLVLKALEIVG